MEKEIATEVQKKSGAAGFMKPKTLFIASLACLVLAVFVMFIPVLFEALEMADAPLNNLLRLFASNISGSVRLVLMGLLLPVSLLLLADNAKKVKLSKIFLLIGGLFILAQIISILVMALCGIVSLAYEDNYYDSYYTSIFYPLQLLFSWIPGCTLLSDPLNFLFDLFDGNWGFLTLLVKFVSVIFSCVGCLLVILSNVISTVGFFTLGKKQKAAEIEVAEEA